MAEDRESQRGYKQYREALRAAAGYRCEYCGVSEGALTPIDVTGTGLFAIAHYFPQSTHPHLAKRFENLVYSCRFCNHAIGNSPPICDRPELRLIYRRNPDYEMHLQLNSDGILEALTDTGSFTLQLANLNDPRKVRLRRFEKEKQVERRRIIDSLLAIYSLLETEALPPDKQLSIREELSRMAVKLRETYGDLPDAIDVHRINKADILVFDSLEAERQLTPFIISYLRNKPDDFLRLDPQVFEQLVGEFFSSWGYEVKLLGRNPRTSADILALRKEEPPGFELRYMIEVKRERNRIGIEEIQRTLGVFLSEKPTRGWDVAFLFSASGFKDFRKTSPADLRKLGLVLKDGVDIRRYLLEYRPRVDGGLWLPNGWHRGEFN
jgi:HJR/Mrr/RecB family endonuclease